MRLLDYPELRGIIADQPYRLLFATAKYRLICAYCGQPSARPRSTWGS
jgi:hypothetical protein